MLSVVRFMTQSVLQVFKLSDSIWFQQIRELLMAKRKGPRFLLPTFLCAKIYINRETSGNEVGFGLVSLWEYSIKNNLLLPCWHLLPVKP